MLLRGNPTLLDANYRMHSHAEHGNENTSWVH